VLAFNLRRQVRPSFGGDNSGAFIAVHAAMRLTSGVHADHLHRQLVKIGGRSWAKSSPYHDEASSIVSTGDLGVHEEAERCPIFFNRTTFRSLLPFFGSLMSESPQRTLCRFPTRRPHGCISVCMTACFSS
jgi:hypothetical protein